MKIDYTLTVTKKNYRNESLGYNISQKKKKNPPATDGRASPVLLRLQNIFFQVYGHITVSVFQLPLQIPQSAH